MEQAVLVEKAQAYLHKLCVDIDSRRVGSQGNREATAFFIDTVAPFGWAVETTAFDCIDWSDDGVDLAVGKTRFAALASPYSLGGKVRGQLAVVTTVDELEATDLADAVLLLHGEIAAEPLMPKNFPFYNPEGHQRIIAALEAQHPQAIITASARNPAMVGAVYPFPMFEDGDFDIPSVYMTDVEGQRLARYAGQLVSLTGRAQRIVAQADNVTARKGGNPQRRVVVFAHIDARIGSPGASDNASGVIVLLLLAELLADYHGDLTLELVPVNGEDYYSNPGERLWLAANAGRFDQIPLGINVDDVGYCKGKVAYSLYECPPATAGAVREVFSTYDVLAEGEPWYQGDHGIWLTNGVPALALTSDQLAELMAGITHSPQDRPEIIDPERLVTVAMALRDLLIRLDQPGFRISREESAAHNLPPVEISVDVSGMGAVLWRFPAPRVYVHLSGPPGTPLGMAIEAYTNLKDDSQSLLALARRRTASARAVMMGEVEQVTLGGRSLLAIGWLSGESQARARHCLALFPAAEGAADGVLVELQAAAPPGATPMCSGIASIRPFDSLHIRF